MASPVVNLKTKRMTGRLVGVIFRSEDTGYTVARFVGDQNQEFRIVGSFPELLSDTDYELTGEWQKHAKYGWQFRVDEYRRLQPTTPQIIKYLSSGIIKGIGPSLAERIVARFGKDSLNIMRTNPAKLRSIPGIGDARARQISESLRKVEQMEEALIFLKGHNIGTGTAVKIIKRYGKNTIKIVSQNPYRLIDDVFGIGFLKADEIARKTGIKADSPYRIQAALLHVLKTASQEGHVYVPENMLVRGEGAFKGAVELLKIQASQAKEQLEELIRKGSVVRDNKRIYLAELHGAETRIASKLVRLKETAKKLKAKDVEKRIERYERKNGISFAPLQRQAIKTAVEHGVMLLTGGPGTGKTTTLQGIIHILEQSGLSVELAAPTGRAAKRMSEACGRPAQTIHRLLGYTVDETTGRMHFVHNASNPLLTDVVIVDESSMLDTMLTDKLLQAIKEGTRVIFVGDRDQLPSVGAGNVIADLIASGTVPTIMLETIFRQAHESLIVKNAHLINRGQMPEMDAEISRGRDFWFCEANTNEEILKRLEWLYTFHLEDYHPIHDVQVLTPMRRTDVGIEALNKMLQDLLNPPSPMKKEFRVGTYIYRVGDKCMIQRNNYDKDVFNGDTGIIVDVDQNQRTITLQMSDDGRHVVLESNELNQIALSYACSIHKSQGSEWPCVIVVVSTSHAIMLQRNLLYTGITRARKHAVVIGSKKAVAMAVRNNKVTKRYSGLSQRLQPHKDPAVQVIAPAPRPLLRDGPSATQKQKTYSQMQLLHV